MSQKHNFRFLAGFSKIEESTMTMIEAKEHALALAHDRQEKVQIQGFNVPLTRWELLGIYNPDGSHVDAFGDFHPVTTNDNGKDTKSNG